MHVPAERIRRQIVEILTAWGMDPAHVETTADVMVDTDLAGIDSHGISMMMMYEEMRDQGRLRLTAQPKVVRETVVTALIDAGGGLGHPAGVMAMDLAAEKALAAGLGAVTVFNSHHFGAAGFYAAMAARRGLLGIVTSTARTMAVVPTRASVPVLGTNPIAFAAPAGRHEPFLLDMATSTVAANKVKVYDLNGKTLPEGWVMDAAGGPITDAGQAMQTIFREPGGGLTPIGGTPEMGSHKGYGLGMLAQILAGTLGGADFSPISNKTKGAGQPDNIGHFCLAIDPKAFRAAGAFEDDLDAMIESLHAMPAIDPARPVLVAGEPETATREARRKDGVPVPATLADKLKAICERAGAPFVLESDPVR